jgi:phenylpropionate dioxygenase-like ring-hydroxylating dioxygenase large terminal subunit
VSPEHDWLLIAHRSDLGTPNDFVRLPIGSEGIVAFNDGGNIIVTDGICPHRGARMVEKPFGNAPLVCPYHGWSYSAGKLNIPHCSNYPVVETAKAKLRQYLTCWVGDWLFASEGNSGYPVESPKVRALLESIKITSRRHFESMPMSCDWRIAVENTLEDLHVPTVHRDTFGKLGLQRTAMEAHGKNSLALYEVTDKRILMLGERLAPHFENTRPDEYFHLFLYPYACLSSLGGFTYSLQHYMPMGAWTQFSTRLYVGAAKPDAPDYRWFYDEAHAFNKLVFQQDAEICAKVAGFGHALSDDEIRVRWFRQALA